MSSKGITRERNGLILQELFKVMLENPDGVRAKDAIGIVASRVKLTDHERGEYEPGARRFDKILRFSTVDAVKAGWMRKNKGIWTITEEGQQALKDFSKPEEFYQEVSRLYRKWRKSTLDEIGVRGTLYLIIVIKFVAVMAAEFRGHLT